MAFWDKMTGLPSVETATVAWQNLDSEAGLQQIIARSHEQPQVIFKHSTRCSISTMAKRRFENDWTAKEGAAALHYLDLIAFRHVSNQIAETFGVVHQSPQVLVIRNGRSVYDASHGAIVAEDVQANLG